MRRYVIHPFYVTTDDAEIGMPVKFIDRSGETPDIDGFLRAGDEKDLIALFDGSLEELIYLKTTDYDPDAVESRRNDRPPFSRVPPRKFRIWYRRIVIE
jgi:hypothetical protein